MRGIVITAVIIISIAIIIPGILSLAIRKIPSGFQPSLTDAQSINKDISAQQSFIAKNNLLSGIGLSIKNPYYRNSKDLIFELADENNQLLRTVKINGKNITDGNYVIISFEPIENSENRLFTFRLSAPDVVSAEAVEIYHSDQNPTDGGTYIVNNEQKSGQLSFVSYYKTSSPISSIISIYRNWIFNFFQDLPFAIFYSVAVALLLGFSIINFLQKKL